MSSTSQQRLMRAGAVIADKYRIDKAIARGGFSIVYRGTHIDMQRPVGLKVLTIDEDIRASWLERFTREARLASQLTHPNTVTIYDYGQDPRGFLYIVMEWVEGVSLHQYLGQRGALGAPAVARICVQILDSLQEAHQRNFLHRDLKPSNIMLTRDYQGQNTVKVLDFGIAKDLSEKPDSSARITHQGAFVGTPRYASPEQLKQSEQLGPTSDIYSLGLLMWEALVGDPAVSSTRYGDCVETHLSPEPWRLPASVFCPVGFERILYKALAKSADQRYQSCGAMRRDLQAWLNTPQAKDEERAGEIFSSAPTSAPPPLPKPPAHPGEAGTSQSSFAAKASQPHAAAEDEGDALARDLERIAQEASDNPVGHPVQARNPAAGPVLQRSSAAQPAPAERAASPPNMTAPRQPTSSKAPLLIGGALAAGLLVAALGWWALAGDQASPNPAPAERAQAPSTDAPPPNDSTPNNPAPTPPRPAPPLATYSPELVWAAVQESGWRRIGKISSFEVGAITQENGRFRKKGKTIALTVYSADTIDAMPNYAEIAEPPIQVLDLGRTAVQIAPGTPSGSDEGVYDVMRTLRKLKEIAESQAQERAPN